MAFRIQLPAGFRWSRLIGASIGLAIPLWALILMATSNGRQERGFVVLGFLGSGAFIFAAILIITNTSWLWFRPFGRILDSLFHPEETITQPPDDLLRALRQRLRDRYWESAAQQLDALQKAYGPSPELFHLRAHLSAGQTGDYRVVNNAAVRALPSRGFDRYTALLRRDPPPRDAQTGIDA